MRELWASTSQHVAQLPSRSAGLRLLQISSAAVAAIRRGREKILKGRRSKERDLRYLLLPSRRAGQISSAPPCLGIPCQNYIAS